MLLENRIALITGASRGIGKAIAECFVAQGAAVVITARSSMIYEVGGELALKGPSVTALQGDVTEDSAVREWVKTCRAKHGRIDVLVNCAGVLMQGLLGMTTSEVTNQMFSANVLSVINLTQYAVRLMSSSTAPSIINISSIAGTQGLTGASIYSATKAAVIGFTVAAAKELAPRKIRVNAIAPGFIETDMTRSLGEESYRQSVARIRMGRAGRPQDVANAALFLASDLSSYVTGQVLGVDGGYSV